MAEEINRRTLKSALRKLPAYDPPDMVWDHIAESLHENPLHAAIGNLPQYGPPAEVWEGIENKLEGETRAGAKVKRLSTKAWFSAAAAIALLLVAIFWLLPNNAGSDPEVSLSYSQENMLLSRPMQEPEEMENYFSQILQVFEEQPFMKDLVDYERLRGELDELNEARNALQGALERYGEDADLVRQLSRLERDRSDILKELAAAI